MMRSGGRAWRLGALLLAVPCLAACGLLVSFDDYDTSSGASYAVRVSVDGLGDAKVTLLLNGVSALTVGDGQHVFAERLADRASWEIRVAEPVPGHPCTFDPARGTIAGADAAVVQVHCPVSHDADLVNLSTSAGDLSPTFDTRREGYTTAPVVLATLFVPDTEATVTATAREPGAVVSIQGKTAVSGKPMAGIPLAVGTTSIPILVTAADGVTQRRYAIDVPGRHVSGEYFKASNTRAGANFGVSVAIAGDTMVVGSRAEKSLAKGVNGAQGAGPSTTSSVGAAYVFTRSGGVWSQQAYLKASNTRGDIGAEFGTSVAISGDTVVVGAPFESSKSTGVNGDQLDVSAVNSGAVYVFSRSGTTWSQQAYIKPSTTRPVMRFGQAVSLSGDTLAVGADLESGNAVGVNGVETDITPNLRAGAAYVFTRSGTTWSQQAYLKASNTRQEDAYFGAPLAVSGNSLVVGASGETSNATGVNGNQADSSAPSAGAAYVFTRTGATWSQEAYLKASNTRAQARFAASVAILGDTVAIGSPDESSGKAGDPNDTSAGAAGAVYVFGRSGSTWSQRAYVKPRQPHAGARFGASVALSEGRLAAGSPEESSSAVGFDGDESDVSTLKAGAAFLFAQNASGFSQRAYLKATNTRAGTLFGDSIALSGEAIAIGSTWESSGATGVNGNAADTSVALSGAVYLYR